MFTVIDIETTGLSKLRHRITEIGAVRVKGGEVQETFQTLVNPGVKIPKFITRLTGIDNEMIKDAPHVRDVLPDFLKFLKDDVFVAHNATFDFGFLHYNLERYHNYELTNNRLCTRKLANRLYPDLSRKRLGDLCEYFCVRNEDSHRALGDAKATAEVFSNMLGTLKEKGVEEKEDILKFEKLPVRKALSIQVENC